MMWSQNSPEIKMVGLKMTGKLCPNQEIRRKRTGMNRGGVRQPSVQRRVLRRFWEGFWGRGSQKGFEKGVFYGFYI